MLIISLDYIDNMHASLEWSSVHWNKNLKV